MIIEYLVECFIFLLRVFSWIFIGAIALTFAGLILTIIVVVVKEKGAGRREEKAKDTRVD